MIKQAEKLKSKPIVVRRRRSWSSSFTRKMSAVGKVASARAIQQAVDHDTPYFYLENGVIVQGPSTPKNGRS